MCVYGGSVFSGCVVVFFVARLAMLLLGRRVCGGRWAVGGSALGKWAVVWFVAGWVDWWGLAKLAWICIYIYTYMYVYIYIYMCA